MPDAPFFRWSLAILLAVVLLLLAAGILNWPFWWISVPGAALLGGVALHRRWLSSGSVRGTVAWELPPFVVAMYVVVAGVYRALEPALVPLAESTAQLSGPLALSGATVIATVGANAVNNLPFSLAAIQFLQGVPSDVAAPSGRSIRDALAYGTLLGVNLGPNLTVSGSLATMLCLASARRQGIRITPMAFTRTGALVTPPMLLAAWLTLWLMLRIG